VGGRDPAEGDAGELFSPVPGPPTLGLFALNMAPTIGPRESAEVAQFAESLGYESIWVGEHPALPDPPRAASPFEASLELVDPIVELSFLAGITRTIRLATGVIILPLRNPIVLAKQLASLDVMSHGRLLFGHGVGYIEPTFRAAGVPFKDRLARSLQYADAMRSLWYDESPKYDGTYVSFRGIDAHPRPIQRAIPMITGGHAPAALRAAVHSADGWYGFGLPPDTTALMMDTLMRESRQRPRPAHLPQLEITVTPPRGAIDASTVARYQHTGVHRLVLFPPHGLTLPELLAFVRCNAPSEVGATPWPG